MTELVDSRAVGLTDVGAVADGVVDLVRTVHRTRLRFAQAAAHDVELASHALLRCLRAEGPLRSGAIAECLQSDPSTISRQVAALVKDGLLERRADPEDGRATLLVLTPLADDVLADHDRVRLEFFAEMLRDWDETDLRNFAALLSRFSGAYDVMNTEWITERIAGRAARAGSKH
jgi:DNA-binding MarR family transcriptional regulator